MNPNQPPPPGYYYPPPQPPRSGASTAIVIVAVVLGSIMVLGILAAIAIPAFLDYSKKAKKSEAERQLKKAERGIRSYVAETGQLPPTGDGSFTPDVPCCDQPGRKCAADFAQWDREPWNAFFFSVDDAGYYQYRYESDGSSFTMTASGDLDCDGISAEYLLTGSLVGGDLSISLLPPTRSD